eukprot:COSAG02_NODE_9805_length_2105_cov_4.419242_2_plen_284_part_00
MSVAEPPIRVTVQELTGKKYEILVVATNASIGGLKRLISQQHEGAPEPDALHLIAHSPNGTVLSDDTMPLSEVAIVEGSVVHLSLQAVAVGRRKRQEYEAARAEAAAKRVAAEEQEQNEARREAERQRQRQNEARREAERQRQNEARREARRQSNRRRNEAMANCCGRVCRYVWACGWRYGSVLTMLCGWVVSEYGLWSGHPDLTMSYGIRGGAAFLVGALWFDCCLSGHSYQWERGVSEPCARINGFWAGLACYGIFGVMTVLLNSEPMSTSSLPRPLRPRL